MKSLYRAGYTKTVVQELKNYKIDFGILQETRWTGYGECIIDKYSILYSGRTDNLHQQGVAICMPERVRKTLIDFKAINERLISIRISGKWFNITIIGLYAPTEDSTDEDKDVFYDKLQEVVD